MLGGAKKAESSSIYGYFKKSLSVESASKT
jgi:hypothetical protein